MGNDQGDSEESMINARIIQLMEKSGKSYFALADLTNYLGAPSATLKVSLSRLVKQKKIVRIARGYYSLPQRLPDLEQLAVEIGYPAYISLESALSAQGILSQAPAQYTLVTTNRSRSLTAAGTTLEYSHIQPRLFWGFKIIKQSQIARPEKALLDELYLIGLKKRSLDIRELDIKGLDWRLFKKWLKLYPPSTYRLAGQLGLV